MKILRRTSAIIGLALGSAIFALPAVAAQINAGLEPIASTIGLGTADVRTIVARVINVALGLLGTILLVIIVYAGFLWMTAGGDDEKVSRAKTLIKNGVIGLAIILSSYAITYFVVTRLMGVREGTTGPSEQVVIRNLGDYGTGSLGEGIIQSHFPAPGQTDVARNTKIIVTFKTAIDPTTIITNGAAAPNGNSATVYTGDLNLANARLVPTADIASGGVFATSSDRLVSGIRAYTVDNRTFVFAPANLLGSPTTDVSYTMALGTGIRLANGQAAFSGNYSSGYHWEFATGTMVDIIPPKIISVMPSPNATVARNALIEITFDEAVDPTSATGAYVAGNLLFSNVTVTGAAGRVQGTWEPANQYRTIGFRSNVRGGTNSCGDDVYVLPGGTRIDVAALAATVGDAPPAARFYPPDGITDLASNSLDGNGNGTADGQPADTFRWNFTTTDNLDLTPPRIVSTEPAAESGNADLGEPIAMTFSKPLAITTLDNRNLILDSVPKIPLWYFGTGVNLRPDGTPVQSVNDEVDRTNAVIEHQRFAPTIGKCSDGVRAGDNCAVDADCPAAICGRTVFNYYPKATSGVTDIYQNCFLPACGDDPDRRYCCPTENGSVSCRTECAVNATSGGLYCDESQP
jgi:hypothetical protein